MTGHEDMASAYTGEGLVDIRKNFSTEMIIKHWNGLPRDMIESSSVEVFKKWMWHLVLWPC